MGRKLGSHQTEKVKQNISIKLKGRKLSQNTKTLMSLARKRTITTEKTKKILSEAQKKAWREGKYTKERNNKVGHKGNKHPNWKGGISFEPYSINWTDTLKRAIREKYKYTCQLCFSEGLDVHHIDYDKENCNPENLITLCKSCHMKTGFNRETWKAYFKNERNNFKGNNR